MIIDKLIETLATIRKESVEDYTVVIPFGGKPKRINYKNEHFGTILHECGTKVVFENKDLEIVVKSKV